MSGKYQVTYTLGDKLDLDLLNVCYELMIKGRGYNVIKDIQFFLESLDVSLENEKETNWSIKFYKTE